jgi:hypothetical protein
VVYSAQNIFTSKLIKKWDRDSKRNSILAIYINPKRSFSLHRIFISHSSQDNVVAQSVKEFLENHGHRSLFLDFDPKDGIPAGRNWEQELYQRIRNCQAVVVVCSRASMAMGTIGSYAELPPPDLAGVTRLPRASSSSTAYITSAIRML